MALGTILLLMVTAAPPDWVETEPRKVGDAYQITYAVGPCLSRLECEAKLRQEIHKPLDDYVAMAIGPEARGRVRLPWEYIRDHLIRDEWEEPRQVSLSPTQQVEMVRLHVRLLLDREADERLRQAWDQAVVNERLSAAGVLLGGTLLLMTGVWGYLKIDLATAGRYRGRLRMAAVAVVAILAALVAILSQQP